METYESHTTGHRNHLWPSVSFSTNINVENIRTKSVVDFKFNCKAGERIINVVMNDMRRETEHYPLLIIDRATIRRPRK